MLAPYILISSELNLHREVLEGVLQAERPHLRVHAVAPADLHTWPDFRELRLIICNDQEIIRRTHPFAWILLFPDGKNLAQVGIGAARRTLNDASIQELVGVIDEVWSLSALPTE
jgi:hypothetical protein